MGEIDIEPNRKIEIEVDKTPKVIEIELEGIGNIKGSNFRAENVRAIKIINIKSEIRKIVLQTDKKGKLRLRF